MNNIVNRQHVLPGKSIERFYNCRNSIRLYMISQQKSIPANKNNCLLSAERLWDQRAEQGYGKHIEDHFQAAMDKIIKENRTHLTDMENDLVSEFYFLWCLRFEGTINSDLSQDLKLDGIEGCDLTEDQKKNLELNHISYFEDHGVFKGRFSLGLTIQKEIDRLRHENKHRRWIVLESKNLDFIVPDNPIGIWQIPITPKICLLEQEFIAYIAADRLPKHIGSSRKKFSISDYLLNQTLTDAQISLLNVMSILRSKKYYFAKELGRCF